MRRSAPTLRLPLWLVASALLSTLTAAERVVPDPGTRVVDTAHVLAGRDVQRIDAVLTRLEAATKAQVKVLTLPDLGGDDVVAAAQRHYDAWKLGRARVDDGALILLAVADRKVRIHTGYGLEGALPDSFCGTLTREAAKRHFAQQAYGDGLALIVDGVATRIADEAGVKLDGVARPQLSPPSSAMPLPLLPPIIIITIIVLKLLMRRRRGWGMRGGWGGPTIFPPLGGGWGGRSGGFGGGFGGSGGGSFGGGGSSGGGGGGASW